jgi:hypothetical protein
VGSIAKYVFSRPYDDEHDRMGELRRGAHSEEGPLGRIHFNEVVVVV